MNRPFTGSFWDVAVISSQRFPLCIRRKSLPNDALNPSSHRTSIPYDPRVTDTILGDGLGFLVGISLLLRTSVRCRAGDLPLYNLEPLFHVLNAVRAQRRRPLNRYGAFGERENVLSHGLFFRQWQNDTPWRRCRFCL